MPSPKDIVIKKMYNHDPFSKWLGIKVNHVEEGFCVCSMKVRKKMLNGFSIAHGGIAHSLADSTLAFAANSTGMKAITLETTTSYLKICRVGDILLARSKELSRTRKFGRYQIDIINDREDQIASFNGLVYFNGDKW